jgi:hypothetical protein
MLGKWFGTFSGSGFGTFSEIYIPEIQEFSVGL